MIVNWCDIKEYFKAGDVVYACAYQPTSDKEGKHNYQKPIRGRLVLDSTEAKCREREQKGCTEPGYFVPFKKSGNSLAWSKAVTIYSRYFTDDENECREFYNGLISKQIRWHQYEIEKLKKEFI